MCTVGIHLLLSLCSDQCSSNWALQNKQQQKIPLGSKAADIKDLSYPHWLEQDWQSFPPAPAPALGSPCSQALDLKVFCLPKIWEYFKVTPSAGSPTKEQLLSRWQQELCECVLGLLKSPAGGWNYTEFTQKPSLLIWSLYKNTVMYLIPPSSTIMCYWQNSYPQKIPGFRSESLAHGVQKFISSGWTVFPHLHSAFHGGSTELGNLMPSRNPFLT